MKQLKEFETLEDARAYQAVEGKMIHRNTMNLILAQNNCYNRLKDIGSNPLHPLRDLVSAFIDSTEYNLIQSSPTGQGVIALMQSLIQYEGNDADLTNVLNTSIAAANTTYKPYENVSEYDWRIACGHEIDKKQATPANGYIKITLTQDVEAHRPQIYAEEQGVIIRIAGFKEIEKTGDYVASVPRNYSIFYVDDCYGVFE